MWMCADPVYKLIQNKSTKKKNKVLSVHQSCTCLWSEVLLRALVKLLIGAFTAVRGVHIGQISSVFLFCVQQIFRIFFYLMLWAVVLF